MCKKVVLLKKLGTIVLAYVFGLLIGTVREFYPREVKIIIWHCRKIQHFTCKPVLECSSCSRDNRSRMIFLSIQYSGMFRIGFITLAILLAFPLLLFSLNIRKWLKYAKKGFLSVALALVSGLLWLTSGFFILKDAVPDAGKLQECL